MNWYFNVWRKTFDVRGRAPRWEYLSWLYFTGCIGMALAFVAALGSKLTGSDSSLVLIIPNLFWLASMLPTLALTIRRLHDTGRRGWWLFIYLVPFIGLAVVLVFLLQTASTVRYQLFQGKQRANLP